MRKYEFYQLDVFTDSAFSGNPLAVFTDGEGLSSTEMQKIANEMNLSETVFVLPSERALRRLRIFTPKQELPLAGHPVVGTWNLLSNLGVVKPEKDGLMDILQELELGVLPVAISFFQGKPTQVVMTQGKFKAQETITAEDEISKLATALGLDRSRLVNREDMPIQTVSTGIGSLAVAIRDLESLKDCKIDSNSLSEIYLRYGAVGVYAFSLDTIEDSSSIHARFFAPDDGIPEDPATGSAAGSLSGYLVHHGAIGKKVFTIEQGDFMGRPSRINAEVIGSKGSVSEVKIGGKSVIVAKGELYL